jgi:hypothetical protein
MMIRKACVIGLFCLAPLAGAGAQTITIQRPAPLDPNVSPIRVQISVNFFVPGPANDSEQSTALRGRASRAIYDLAAHECEVLREKLADDCRLENVNVNFNRQLQQLGGQTTEGFQVGGTLGYRISQKLSPSAP